MKIKGVLKFGIAFGLSSLLCGSAYAETLRVLEWGQYVPEKTQKQLIKFAKDKYGMDLKIEIKLVNGNDEFFPALRKKTADVIAPSHNVPKDERYRLMKHKLVLPLDLKNIPNYKKVDPGLQYSDYCTVNKVVYGVPISKGPYGLAYNSAKFKKAPDSWSVFWDPKYKGQYSFGKAQYEENIFSVALAMGYKGNDISNYKKLNNPEFQKKLAAFVANAKSMWDGVDKKEDLKGLAFSTSWGDSLNDLNKMGEPWKMAVPKEGTTAWVDNLMISHTLKDKPKMKRIAEELLNLALSDEYQIDIVRGGTEPTTSTIMGKLTKAEIKKLHLDDKSFFKKYRVLWPTLKKSDRKGLKRLWDKAMKSRK